jgi:hypothetical protein
MHGQQNIKRMKIVPAEKTEAKRRNHSQGDEECNRSSDSR